MFRLFLIKRVAEDLSLAGPKIPTKQYRNRRLYERFDMDHKHLSLLNEHDIFVIQNISETGFLCSVNEHSLERLKIGDQYLCRIRYIHEIYEMTAQLVRKGKDTVAFTLIEPSSSVCEFFQRLINPARIGHSLKPLEHSLRKLSRDAQPLQFHGEDETRLVIWENEAKEPEAWYFEYGGRYMECNADKDILSGKLIAKETDSLAKPWSRNKTQDTHLDPQFRQFVLDVFMTLNYAKNEALIDTLHDLSKLPKIVKLV